MSRDIEKLTTNFTAESAYILGMLWSDGHVSKDMNRVSIEIVEDDMVNIKPIIEKTSSCWLFYRRVRNHWKPQVSAIINSRELSKALCQSNYRDKIFGPNLKLPGKYEHLWFLGLFDGDGCIYQSENKYNTQVSICGDYNQDWSFLTNKLSILDISYTVSLRNTKSGKSSIVRCSNRIGVRRFYDYIYQTYAIDNIGLLRKRIKYSAVLT